jgi:hypothetical protein
MSSRNRRESFDPFEISLREALHARAARATPAPDLRRQLLQRAAKQQRRFPWRLPISWPGLFRESRPAQDHLAAQRHMLYVEHLFGPRLGWFSFNQLMR